ncbi:class I SAM-dependent methyltransferase [Streptococcus ruminantium]|uniref:class I SAM-dependent methyltransferase n=1 Tax=Streptococcus ruminantium TaxID=1917441 RepID=UPI0012DE2BA2|nr:class I SAM-dependent methyltransferase [Streptococcus ruminantium]BDD40722.1 SAM-dependent methyltransferase [Streptococcus ruminantium]
MQYIVTTSLRMNELLVAKAKQIAGGLGVRYVERKKQSVSALLRRVDGILVVYQEQLTLEQKNGQRLFFHPDTAILRIKSGRDPLVELVGASAKRVLDCTMGLASDSIVLASAGHRVTALESSQLIHFIVRQGLQDFDSGDESINQAMRGVKTLWTDSLTYLREQPDKSFDIIYFDPMFSQKIKESQNLAGLAGLANVSRLNEDILHEAKRVAREKIILKAHFRDRVFEELGFVRHIRPNQKFHYGEIIL